MTTRNLLLCSALSLFACGCCIPPPIICGPMPGAYCPSPAVGPPVSPFGQFPGPTASVTPPPLMPTANYVPHWNTAAVPAHSAGPFARFRTRYKDRWSITERYATHEHDDAEILRTSGRVKHGCNCKSCREKRMRRQRVAKHGSSCECDHCSGYVDDACCFGDLTCSANLLCDDCNFGDGMIMDGCSTCGGNYGSDVIYDDYGSGMIYDDSYSVSSPACDCQTGNGEVRVFQNSGEGSSDQQPAPIPPPTPDSSEDEGSGKDVTYLLPPGGELRTISLQIPAAGAAKASSDVETIPSQVVMRRRIQ